MMISLSAATAINYPKVKSIYDSDEDINWVAFGPDGAYVIDTPDRLIASDPAMTRDYTRNGKSSTVPLRCASFGAEGVWVVVEDDGEVRSKGLPTNVSDALSRKEVRRVELNPFSEEGYFIEYTDGTTAYRLPTKWHPQVDDIKKLSIEMDEPADSRIDLTQNIVFVFGPKPDSYCMAHKGHTAWKSCPKELSNRVQEMGAPSAVSMGEDGALFWKIDSQYYVSSETEIAYPEVWKIWKTDKDINWVAFGPEGYYIVDTPKCIYASREDQILRKFENGKQVPIRCASFGYGGSWVIIEDDGVVRSHGLESNVREALLMGNVRHVALSWVDPTHYYIEYTDGATYWNLPEDWTSKVSRIEGELPMPPSVVQRLERIPRDDSEFHLISIDFHATWRDTGKGYPKIKRLYKITLLPMIWDQYKTYL
ncbi:hypothetical protein FRC00_001531 [Tulasnella sp. 408]|nr:hypothetical protein FRC00_001531 [Tulasnella sp. 408]